MYFSLTDFRFLSSVTRHGRPYDRKCSPFFWGKHDMNPAPAHHHKNPWSFIGYAIPVLFYMMGLLYFLADINSLDSFPLDDAWIHQVYARSFAFGRGFEYNSGIQELGATSPLWAMLTSPTHWLEHNDPSRMTLAVKGIGISLGCILLVILQKITYAVTRSFLVSCAAASLFALEPRLLISSLSGMETLLLAALWLGACYSMVRQRWWWAAFFWSLSPVTRPESLLCLLLWMGWVWGYLRTSSVRKRLLLSGVVWLPFAAWAAFCFSVSGHWLPNTFYLKAHAMPLTVKSLRTLWQMSTEYGYTASGIFALGFCWYFVSTVYHRKYRVLFVFTVAAPLAYLFGVGGTRQLIPGFYYWSRWLDPALLVLSAAFCCGFAAIWLTRTNMGIPKFPGLNIVTSRRVRFVLGILLLAASLPYFAQSFQEKRNHFISDSRAIFLINVQAGLWIHEHVPEQSVVGVNDAGAIRYFGGRQTIDLLGLNNREIAFQEKDFAEILAKLDWLAIFPSWYALEYPMIEANFEPQQVFSVPAEEYTICNFPGQNVKVIFKKK